MHYTLKLLTLDDMDLAQALFKHFQEDDGDPFITRASDEYVRGLLARPDFHVLVALAEGEVVGGLTAYDLPMYKEEVTELFLYEIGVNKAHRRHGLARRMMEHLMELAHRRGITEMYVGAIANDLPAEELYRATGGQEVGVSWFTYTFGNATPRAPLPGHGPSHS